jgi:hypothetical protein
MNTILRTPTTEHRPWPVALALGLRQPKGLCMQIVIENANSVVD